MSKPRKLILRNFQSPGDILMLTAALRDLHRCCPKLFLTDVRTSCPDLWQNNPYLTPLRESDPAVRILSCEYPLIHQSNHSSLHFIHGFIQNLNHQLETSIQLGPFHGDIHLSRQELARPSLSHTLAGSAAPYWLIVAGGKHDFTIKWWDFRRYQSVVDHFHNRIQFVQVGEAGHFHPELARVIDLRGKTNLRELIHLVYHAQGVLSPVTLLMHLAAAVPSATQPSARRPCVVVAGGREPPQGEAYPHHQFIHTVGALPCCSEGGCWRSRTLPLGDGDPKDAPERLCCNVVNALPRCMDLITPDAVVQRIEYYFAAGHHSYLAPAQARAWRPFQNPSHRQRILALALP